MNPHAQVIRKVAVEQLELAGHYQLIRIAEMIENNAHVNDIKRVIQSLDIALSDKIPDDTYYAFTEVYEK
jgi:hypothetical protein